ncbi:hypothetical protein GGX14DRAFT_484525 [Mycena pura]|uniref:MYND-type domain-containing protein n=1 Tax=Mycena pura TaxID=153505 RepID=A0AAD6UL69_9AGAR|nr:hypothetical protein GGX14DRAFT_484525 [Mycena pura]
MPQDVENLVHLGEDWCFCGHLKESCNDCCVDHRASNNWGNLTQWLEKSGWPQSEIDRIMEDELDMVRRPVLQAFDIASDAAQSRNSDGELQPVCNAHGTMSCSTCFDFGAFLLQEAELWGKHANYLKKAGLPVPAPPKLPPGVFERRYPRLRGFPDISAVSPAAEHTLVFKYPDFRLLGQLPSFTGHSPLGWVLFGIIVARQSPGVTYKMKDAAGATVKLRFVDSWTKVNGGGDPTGKDAEQYKNLKPGTVLSLKCVTMSMTPRNEPQVAVEKINLSGVKILKSSITDVHTINDKLRNAVPGCCSHCAQAGAPSACLRCKSPYCGKECQAKDWNEGGHKHACSTIAHLRSLNHMFRAAEA